MQASVRPLEKRRLEPGQAGYVYIGGLSLMRTVIDEEHVTRRNAETVNVYPTTICG
jgi:hypothetical protein